MSYVELHAASAFSFLEGASLPEVLVDRAAELGYTSLALVDRDGVYGIPRFHKAALAAGIRPIVGTELTIDGAGLPSRSARLRLPREDSAASYGEAAFSETGAKAGGAGRAGLRPDAKPKAARGISSSATTLPTSPFSILNSANVSSTWRLPVLVESPQGYQNLCRLITQMKLRSPKGEGALGLDEIEGHTGGLLALVGREALVASRHGVGGLVQRLVDLFGRDNVCVEVQRHLQRDEEADNQALVTLASAFHVPLVATNGVRFATSGDRPLFDVLTCVRHKTDLDHAGRRLAANAERYLKSPAEMSALFHDLPDAVAGTAALADRLRYTMADLGYRFPEYPVPQGEDMNSFLRKIVEVGARERYRPYHERARAQMARELALIEKLGLAGYFLIVWDIVNFCRQEGILAQGRGSAANSAVCYSLGITAVDPVGMDLLFERFLSEERGEWPDIDLDLPSGDRRERVIQHVYEKYGRHGAAMTANVITYRGRSAAREVGKALALEPEQVDRLAKVINHFEFRDPDESIAQHLEAVGLDRNHPRIRMFGDLWQAVQDLPRHLGQHSGGMVICRGQLDAVVPLENASMPGRVVVQWDKDDCADMGIVKIDLLGLGMMAVLQDSLEIINARRPAARGERPETKDHPLALWNMPPDDADVYRMLQQADTMGVFQVESRAQMATLPRLKPDHFYDIVVEVAIIRPGPIVGQMVHPYLNRRAGREPVVYPHPSLEPILQRTLGVPLFQEQLLRMAMVAAGFTGGQAEELRRAFGFKRSERRMEQIEVQLREGMARKGITGQACEDIIRSITSFALYGFPESHAASFALLVYASAYLKAHFPAAFYAALLNNQPMGFYHPATLVKDAQRRGVRFASIDVQRSGWLCAIEPDGAVRLGLCYVNGLRADVGKAIDKVTCGIRLPFDFAQGRQPDSPPANRCPKCGCDDASLLEIGVERGSVSGFCNNCAHDWKARARDRRFASLDDLIAKSGVNREEISTLAEIGALNSFGYDRREALWQVERAIRPAGELFTDEQAPVGQGFSLAGSRDPRTFRPSDNANSPLTPMTETERIAADYSGTSLTIGPHPMALRRGEMALRGVLRARDLPAERDGRRVRVAGAVITRQRPGTAKGFVFLTLEDETGIANIIVRPDLFARERMKIIQERFLLIEGRLQNQEGITSVRAERLEPLGGARIDVESHDFY